MAVKKSQVALHVRVKLNEKFKPKCLGDEYLMKDKVVFIKDNMVRNDSIGDYVYIGSVFNGGTAYLDQIDLEFPISDIGEAMPTKLDKKIAELEAEVKKDFEVLGRSTSLEKKQEGGATLTEEEKKEVLVLGAWLQVNNTLQTNVKLLNELKELV